MFDFLRSFVFKNDSSLSYLKLQSIILCYLEKGKKPDWEVKVLIINRLSFNSLTEMVKFIFNSCGQKQSAIYHLSF